MRAGVRAGSGRRRLILDRAAPLFARKGIGGCTVREIAEATGILSGSLYHYFDSKDAIVEEIVAEYLGELDAAYGAVLATGGDAATRLRALVLASLRVSHAHPHATEVYQLNRGHFTSHDRFAAVREAAARIFRTWQEAIADGVAEHAFRRDVEARVFHRFLRDAVFLSVRWFRPSEVYGVEELATDTAEIFLEGFGADE